MKFNPSAFEFVKGHPYYGDLMTRKDFQAAVDCGGYIDYDGDLRPANADGHWETFGSGLGVKDIKDMPAEVTHVLWFSR